VTSGSGAEMPSYLNTLHPKSVSREIAGGGVDRQAQAPETAFLRPGNAPFLANTLSADLGLPHLDVPAPDGRNREDLAVDDDEIGEIPGLQESEDEWRRGQLIDR
jgi:hypothetical protein